MPQDDPDASKPSQDPLESIKHIQGQILCGELLLPEKIKNRGSDGPAEWIAMQSIEVERHEPFFRQSREVESAKLHAYGRINYWKYVLRRLQDSTAIALRQLSVFMREASQPGCRLPDEHCQSSKGEGQVSWLGAGKYGRTNRKRNLDGERYSFLNSIETDRAKKIASLLETLPDL